MRIHYIIVVVFLIGFVSSYPTGDSKDAAPEIGLVYTSEELAKDIEKQKVQNDEPLRHLHLKSMHVKSSVTNRYATTTISNRYANPGDKAQEATFSVVLPDKAFISGFIMEIKGKQYKAYVEEKKEAKRIYDQAVASGLGAAHVAADARDSNRFTVSMNVEPHDKVIFNLTYEQLLVRRHGKYEMVINIHPGQVVKDMSVDVFINETRRLTNVATPALRSGNEILEDTGKKNEYATIKVLNEDYTTAYIHFAPTVEEQKVMARLLEKDRPAYTGISGQFVVEYDVERDPSGGQVLVSDDGYFVHFFAPSKLKAIPKHVVFVLDVSGSMHGRKIQQVKQAMQVILEQLTPADYFNIVEFSFGAKVWNLENITDSPRFESSTRFSWWRPENEKPTENQELPPAFPAIAKNIATAKKIIDEMESNGGTNIYDALSTAVNITNAGVPVENPPRPIIIFLTDGEATDGETDSKKIIDMVETGNGGDEKAALFTLAFGSDANKEFLKKISLKNNGFMRHIYEAADASLQLQDFYKSISSLLLANVEFKYPSTKSETLTKHNFHTLFEGGELIVAGKMTVNDENSEGFKVQAMTVNGPIDFLPKVIKWIPRPVAIGELERLWAYMSIRQLLDEASAKDQKESPEKKKALDLALKYSFVTPVTSLVVVKPNETKSVETEEAHPANRQPSFGSQSALFGISAPASSLAGFGAGVRASFMGGLPGPPAFAAYDIAPARIAAFKPFHSTAFTESDKTAISLPDFDTIPVTTTPRIFFTTTKSVSKHTQDLTIALPWLSTIIHSDNPDILNINDKSYHIGSNETIVEEKTCEIATSGLSGNCTLIFACPNIYSKLTDLDTYKQYFCTLDSDKYAGVCCVQEP